MDYIDKIKIKGTTYKISDPDASQVSFSRSLNSGTKIGTITINNTATDLYCETNTDTTYSDMTAATNSTAGAHGLVPAPASGKQDSFLRGNATWADASTIINTLSTGNSTPTDNDYYVSQYAGGGTTTTTYHRRPISALWTYIKNKINATNSAPTLSWGTTSTIGTVAGTSLQVKMPANPNTDTKNTAGATNTNSKIYLVGATSQGANPQTYSHDSVYVGTDGCLYSNSEKTYTISGGEVNGTITINNGNELHLTANSNNYSGDIVFQYYNNNEKARIWTIN